MAIEGSTSKVYDPKLRIAGEEIPFTGNSPVHILGGIIQVPRNPASAREAIVTLAVGRVSTALLGPHHKQILSVMVGEVSRPTGDPMLEEVGRPGEASRPSQTIPTQGVWWLQPSSPINTLPEAPNGQSEPADYVNRQ